MKFLKDIRFWIFLFFVIRLFGITDAPLEMGHNYRQALTNMIARNFLEISPNILYPRIDMAGAKTGIIGSEFPLFSYLIFLIAKVFGYDHWYGRLISLILSSVSIYYFYLIVKRFFSAQTAFNAAIILTISIWFSFSRKIMPDVFSVSLIIIGLYYCLKYFETGKLSSLILYFVLTTTSLLCKIPALSLLSILVIPLVSKYQINRKIAVVVLTVCSGLIASWWYFYWAPYLVETYQFKLFYPKGLLEGFNEIIQYPFDTLDKFWFTAFYSFVAFAAFITGLVLMIIKKERLMIAAFSVVTAFFFIFILKTGSIFSFHNYYIIPFVPVMALLAGYALTHVKIKWQIVVLFLITVESLANQAYDFRIKETEVYKLALEKNIENIVDKHDLIIVNGESNPQTIYFLHRKGWTVSNEELSDPAFIDEKIGYGAKYLIIDNHRSDQSFSYALVYSNESIDVYNLKLPK